MQDINGEDIFWHDYQTKARSTAIYPRQGRNSLYPTLGLIGEIGEITNKISKVIRDDNDQITEQRRQEIGDEIGDALWYIANLCYELSIFFTDSTEFNMNQLVNIPPNILHVDNKDLYIEILEIQSSLSIISEEIKYVNFAVCTHSETQRYLRNNIGMVLFHLYTISILLNLDLREIATQNIEKLFNRKDRGVLGGSGDGR